MLRNTAPYVGPKKIFQPLPASCACVGGTSPCVSTEVQCDCGTEFAGCPQRRVSICPECLAAKERCARCYKPPARCRCAAVEKGLNAYHAVERRKPLATPDLSSMDPEDPLIGFEVETMKTPGVLDVWGKIDHEVGAAILTMETDGSLGSGGGEVITRPFPLDIWRQALPDVMASILAVSDPSHSRCGGHIHVTATTTMRVGADAVVRSYGRPDQLPVWSAIAGRAPEYSPPPTVGASLASGRSSRCALYVHARGATLEWRHPCGTGDPRVMLGRAELIVDVLNHAARFVRKGVNTEAGWGWGLYLRDRPRPTTETRYAFALLRSLGY